MMENQIVILITVFVSGIIVGWASTSLYSGNKMFHEMRARFLEQRDRVTAEIDKSRNRMSR